MNSNTMNSPYQVNMPLGAGGGGIGQVITTTGIGSAGGSYTYSDTISVSDWNVPLNVKGDAKIEGDLLVNGKSLSDTLNKIEERLAILHPNKELESKWDELKELGKRYRELEKDIIEKEKIWNELKK